MMRRFKTLLFVTVMALAVMTWAGWSPASAYTESDHTAVEETMGQEDEAIEEDGAIEEEDNGAMEEEGGADQENVDGEQDYQDEPEAEPQEGSPYNN